MIQKARHTISPIYNANGSALIIIVVLLLFIAIAGGGGYFAYNKYIKPPPLKTKFSTIKIKKELIQFSNDYISPALYNNMVMIEDIVVMMDKELDRLKRIGKQFPNQRDIVSPQTNDLGNARKRLSAKLSETAALVETIYVTWLVDQAEGISRIRSQKKILAQDLANAIRNEAVHIGRIKKNSAPPS